MCLTWKIVKSKILSILRRNWIGIFVPLIFLLFHCSIYVSYCLHYYNQSRTAYYTFYKGNMSWAMTVVRGVNEECMKPWPGLRFQVNYCFKANTQRYWKHYRSMTSNCDKVGIGDLYIRVRKITPALFVRQNVFPLASIPKGKLIVRRQPSKKEAKRRKPIHQHQALYSALCIV